MEHTHNWQYQGIVWSIGSQLPGSGACERIYEDAYYCNICLEMAYRNPRVQGNTYDKALIGTFPK